MALHWRVDTYGNGNEVWRASGPGPGYYRIRQTLIGGQINWCGDHSEGLRRMLNYKHEGPWDSIEEAKADIEKAHLSYKSKGMQVHELINELQGMSPGEVRILSPWSNNTLYIKEIREDDRGDVVIETEENQTTD